jgi:hypothetical protein
MDQNAIETACLAEDARAERAARDRMRAARAAYLVTRDAYIVARDACDAAHAIYVAARDAHEQAEYDATAVECSDDEDCGWSGTVAGCAAEGDLLVCPTCHSYLAGQELDCDDWAHERRQLSCDQ